MTISAFLIKLWTCAFHLSTGGPLIGNSKYSSWLMSQSCLPWIALSPNLSNTLWVTLMLLPLRSFLPFCITISPQCKFWWHFLLVQLDRRWLDRLAHTVQVWRKALSRSKGTKVRTAAFYLHRPQEPFVMVSAVMMKRWGLSTVFEVFWLFVNLSQTTPCCCCAAKRFSYHIPVNSICPQIIVRSKVSNGWISPQMT